MRGKPRNLYKRGETWHGRFKVAGDEYRGTLRTGNEAEAKLRLKDWKQRIQRRATGTPDSPSWKEAVIKWAAEILPSAVKPSVSERYLVSIRQLEHTFGALRIADIAGGHIAEYVSLRAGDASNATIRRDLTALSRLLSACVSWGWRSDNPARLYDRSIIRERREPIKPPAPEMVTRFIERCPPGMASIIKLLDQTGMRENEAVTLTSSDVDFKVKQINLMKTKTNRPRTLDWETPGGNAGVALVGLPDAGPLFLAGSGQPYRNFAANAVRIMRDLKAGDKSFVPFRIHDLRHGFAIRWLRSGGDIYRLSLHLGHSSLKTTEGYLGHISARQAAVAQTGAHDARHKRKKKPPGGG